MKRKQIRRELGRHIRKLRDEKKMSLDEVVAYLSLYKVECSRSNLNRIEMENGTIRSDILAGLAMIFEVSADELLYRENKKS